MINIGFGCAGLSSLNNKKTALEVLEHSYSNGISHFDVARLYGMGLTESIVGEFAHNKRHNIKIATKFGLNPPTLIYGKMNAFNFIKKQIKKIPAIHKFAKGQLNSKIDSEFTLQNARLSIEKSLKELKTDYLDYYFLHEATVQDANNEEILDFLENAVKDGKVLKYGIGSSFSKIQDCNFFNSKYNIFQFENNLFQENLIKCKNIENKTLFTHSVFQNIDLLQQNMTTLSTDKINGYSEKFDLDLSDKRNLGGLLLAHSYMLNTLGITLFSSVKKDKISDNLRVFQNFRDKEFLKEDLNDYLKLLI